MTGRRVAEAFPPGDFIKEELDARGWSQAELADIVGRSPKEISDLVSGKRSVSPEIAKELGAALGTSARYWMNLESSYRLWRGDAPDDAIARRSALHQFAPIREMAKRHWLELSESLSITEQRVKAYYGVSSLDERPSLPHAARRGAGEISQAHMAWLFRARQLAGIVQSRTFSKRSFERGLSNLKRLLPSAQEVRHVPEVLADAGIRFLVIEHLPNTKIDGVTFWHGKSPVIALSLRYDRVDCFWHTLAHELGHVESKDGWLLDTGLVGQEPEGGATEAEKDADRFAADFLVRQADFEDFIVRTSPLYSGKRILGFARRMGIHPGIVVGQLQFRGEIPWSSFRPMLEKVRHLITSSAMTDGWGQMPPDLG